MLSGGDAGERGLMSEGVGVGGGMMRRWACFS